MKNVQILFEDAYDDVDIIIVPDDIYDSMKKLCQDFLHWKAPKDDPDYWSVDKNGRIYANAETVGFVKWLNNFYCTGEEKASIIVQHVDYSSDIFTIEF